MASQNIARLGVVLGLDTAEFTASIDKAISENAKLKNAIRRDTNSAAGELKTLIHATEDYGKALTKVELIQREVTSGKFMNATQDMKDRLLQQAAAYDKIALSAKNATGATFKMNEQQKLNLTYQTTDLFTQIASGQSPFIAILQQGGQLKDTMGGLGNMFRAIGSLFTPFSVGLGAVAVGLGAVGLAAYQATEDLDKLRDALTLTGNYSGVTEESFKKLAETLSGQTQASLGTTKEALMGVISSGQFTGTSISAVTQAIITYSQIAGVSAAEATQKLKGGLSGTAEGAKSLNKEMNFLTLEQYKQIEALEKANKKQEAAQLVAVALNTKLEQQRRELGLLEGAWKSVTTAMSNFWDTFKERLSGPTQSQTLDALDKQISDIQKKLAGTPEDEDSVYARGWRKILVSLQASKENILEIQRLQGRSASSKDVTGAKEKIDEYDKYKEMLKGKVNEVAKAEIEARFAVAKQGANEIERLELESKKKIQEAKTEMNQKNAQEDFRAAAQNLEIYKSKVIVAETELAEKKKQIKVRDRIATNKAQAEEEQFYKDMETQFAQMQANAKWDALMQTQSLERQKEALMLKNDMIYASEKELKLAEITLRYQNKRADDAGKGKDVLDNLDAQEKLEKFNVEIADSMKKTQQVFDTVFGNLSSAIDNFVKTGKLNMKDLARSIIQDLIAIQMKAAALRFLGAMFGAPSIVGGNGASGSGTGIQGFGSSYADGGSPTPNTVNLVGERGPELFIPKTAGTIIPNHALGNMGSTTNVTNNYIQAIDTKSFEDRLLGSSNAIWAANQYANKSLAVNRGRA